MNSVNLLYWGDNAQDEAAAQATWQAAEYARLGRAHFLPNRNQPDFKLQIMTAIDEPPVPVGILYFFCHCSVGDGSKPCLRFGNTSKKNDIVERAEFSLKPLIDAPLVFANACATAKADPSMTSELESSFFDRGIRAWQIRCDQPAVPYLSQRLWISTGALRSRSWLRLAFIP